MATAVGEVRIVLPATNTEYDRVMELLLRICLRHKYKGDAVCDRDARGRSGPVLPREHRLECYIMA